MMTTVQVCGAWQLSIERSQDTAGSMAKPWEWSGNGADCAGMERTVREWSGLCVPSTDRNAVSLWVYESSSLVS
jgi:hypothetical protein